MFETSEYRFMGVMKKNTEVFGVTVEETGCGFVLFLLLSQA